MQSFQIPSHGGLLNAFVYVASGPGPHPMVVLLHGFPGNERNLDLAQDRDRKPPGKDQQRVYACAELPPETRNFCNECGSILPE